ncbi:MAG: YggS family pyridoxal phosphate-dependent enzyme [Bacteroidia bacterium]|jgi:pyridoxal phosphate enzyme (YggS family)|nr:YggS family pyridoxal phosphate-dependent enzyme [Bacteroidia bacterium]GIV23854.1 MAG: YggS family pyridoxal phosphate enzyme [Bacteroidia bacterium]
MSYEQVQERIAQAALRAGRKPEEITLLVVSKGQPIEKIQAIYAKGQRLFGENRVQELLQKKLHLPPDIAWHWIGHLQTNKVKAVLPYIQLLHAVDRESLLAELAKRAAAPLDCLIEVKVAQEATKHGITPDQLMAFAERVAALPVLRLRGLMGMATLTTDQAQVRHEFRQLYKLFLQLQKAFPDRPIDILSMGMSGDFEIAVEEGSTLVRVGSAVFEDM